MNALRWIASHWWQTWLLLSAAFVIGWTVYLAFFGESDEQRDARRRARAKVRAEEALAAKRLAIVEEFKTREKARLARNSGEQVDAIVEKVLSGDDDPLARMREAEAFNSTEYERESDGKRIA
jgi:hypothetical protein